MSEALTQFLFFVFHLKKLTYFFSILISEKEAGSIRWPIED